ncbi:hypothetical protein V6N11_080693 [Hibiscus sabdariffa]|uniref:Uncharacterized protein n=1 Tax=Hibiscus sabdariffa TaxID=183260 RepID=A0ABR2QHP1_9ROSI
MVERSLCMREARGSIPRISIFYFCLPEKEPWLVHDSVGNQLNIPHQLESEEANSLKVAKQPDRAYLLSELKDQMVQVESECI